MTNKLSFIPYFLALLVTLIVVFCLVIWRRITHYGNNFSDDDLDLNTWLLLGLLLVAVFGLGAFLMYALLHIG
jgi:uncharacterized membrane protein YphA (DoxX/SURF4 family)